MTTLTVVDSPPQGESFADAIARRLLGEFGQRRLSMSKVAKMVGLSQTAFSRRMTGVLPFTVTEVDHICTVLGIERDYILTGARSLSATPDETTRRRAKLAPRPEAEPL
jgi:transcriptional regulator with XRE-family HTH domain